MLAMGSALSLKSIKKGLPSYSVQIDALMNTSKLNLKKEEDILCPKKNAETGCLNAAVCLKTMCLATRKPGMPNKKEHGLLLCNGLGK